MTIEQIANRIIKNIKAWPLEARQSPGLGGPKTSWDEYKEQVQYEEYDSFEVFEESIESMVRYDVSELSDNRIENLYRSRHAKYCNATGDEKREGIVDAVLSLIKREAESQDINYRKYDIEFIRYFVGDLTIVAEVLEQVSPEEFLIKGYSLATGSGGEQGVANLSVLDDENGLEKIAAAEFVNVRYSLFNNKVSQQLSIEF
jgi:hypothetical protein